jgi:glutathione S-transferase
MLLISTPTSPFGRKVKIADLVYGLKPLIRVETGDPWIEDEQLRKANPLGKMPALVTPEGKAIYDSGVILEYLDTLLESPRLFPTERRIDTLVRHALADGIIEAGLLITYERMRRPAEFTYGPWIDHQRGKIERALTSVLGDAPDPTIADAGSITLACALGYLDWRKQLDWRAAYPAMVEWLDAFRAAFPAFDQTKAEH